MNAVIDMSDASPPKSISTCLVSDPQMPVIRVCNTTQSGPMSCGSGISCSAIGVAARFFSSGFASAGGAGTTSGATPNTSALIAPFSDERVSGHTTGNCSYAVHDPSHPQRTVEPGGTPVIENGTGARDTGDGAADGLAGTTTAYRTCPLCEATCGLELAVRGREIVRGRGDRGGGFSHGCLCAHG